MSETRLGKGKFSLKQFACTRLVAAKRIMPRTLAVAPRLQTAKATNELIIKSSFEIYRRSELPGRNLLCVVVGRLVNDRIIER